MSLRFDGQHLTIKALWIIIVNEPFWTSVATTIKKKISLDFTNDISEVSNVKIFVWTPKVYQITLNHWNVL